MPVVRKKTYHGKKQENNQLKTQNQELIRELASLNRKLLDSQKQNQGLQSQLSQPQLKNNSLKSNSGEREREKSPILPRLSAKEEVPEPNHSSMPYSSEQDSPTTVVGDEEPFPNNSKLTSLLTERNEQLDHAEAFIKTLQIKCDNLCQEYSDYRFKGEYEINRYRHLLACLETQLEEKRGKIIDLACELEQVENQFRVHQITFNEIVRQRDGSWEKLGEISFLLEREILKNQINYDTLKSVVLERERLMKLVQKFTTYWKTYEKKYKKAKTLIQQYQEELRLRTENENILTSRFQTLQKHYQQKKTQNQELADQLEEKAITINHQNQIIRDLENEITDFQTQLTETSQHLDLAHGDIEKQQQAIWENEDYLINSDEVLATKNAQITVLNKQIDQQAQVINQLTNQIRDLNEVIEEKNEDIADLEELEEEKRNKAVNLIQNNKDLVQKFRRQTSKWKKKYKQMAQGRDTYLTERDNLQNWKDNHDCSINCSLPHSPTPHICPIVNNVNCSHADYDDLKNKLTEKELIIQQQVQRIRELENKPPVVETKTQEVEKIKEIEKPIITDTPFGEDLELIKKIDLVGLEQELNILLSLEAKEQIKKAASYKELSFLRNREVKSYLEKNQTEITNQKGKELVKSFEKERMFWISLLVLGLLAVGGLLVKLGRLRKKKVSF